MSLKLLSQSLERSSNFNSPLVLSIGFIKAFGPDGATLAQKALTIINSNYDNDQADWFQRFEYLGAKFYLLDEENYVVALLPTEI